MTWQAIAEKDFRDAVRSYWVWGLSALFIGILAIPPALVLFRVVEVAPTGQTNAETALTTDLFVFLMLGTISLLVPIIAIVVAYASIARERESGSLKLLLSLPHSRLDVVLGKLVGRGAVVVLPVGVGFLVAAFAFVLTPVRIEVATYVGFVVLTILLGLVFVAIAVGISAAARTSRRAMIGTVGVYVLFTLFWSRLVGGLINVLRNNTELDAEFLVPLDLFLRVLNPTQAYESLVIALFTDSAVEARLQLLGGSGLESALIRQAYAEVLGGSVPVFLSDPVVLVVMLGWLGAAPYLGYLAFRESDL